MRFGAVGGRMSLRDAVVEHAVVEARINRLAERFPA